MMKLTTTKNSLKFNMKNIFLSEIKILFDFYSHHI